MVGKLIIRDDQIRELQNLSDGVFTPVDRLVGKEDFEGILSASRLTDGRIWPIPITLDIAEPNYERVKEADRLELYDANGHLVGGIADPEFFTYSKQIYAESIFQTTDDRHPGVKQLKRMGNYLVSGTVKIEDHDNLFYPDHHLLPEQARTLFEDKSWDTVVGFQTRNVPHRGHEFLQRQALTAADGLFIQPVIGEKKLEDFKDEYTITAYEILIDNYLPADRVVLGILPLRMRYAGPREALFHALIRRNYGCSHFIVGRDHAGVGDYYEPFAAQKIFDRFDREDLGVEILTFEEVVYCPEEKRHAFISRCPHEEKIHFSGTKIRGMIKNNEQPAEHLMRPKVYELLHRSVNSLVDTQYKQQSNGNGRGFVLWFTGLSQSGKSTIADAVHEELIKRGLKTERLDGDVVRESLTKDLGFSKEDRDENIRRVGFVAKMLAKNGVAVLASFISPYRAQRRELRDKIENYIEVFVNTPLEVCERRDTKGLYQKAREGIIENFTGISDPYEEPKNPDIELKPAENSVQECVEQVLDYLTEQNLIP